MNLYVITYLVAIIIANLSVAAFGPVISVVNAFLFIGFDLTCRDKLHDAWQGHHLWPKMLALISAGSIISYALNTGAGPIALASFVAFAGAGLADTVVYGLLGERDHLVRVNGSNVVSAGVDSVLFPLLAFGWPPLLWWVFLGQWLAKVFGGLLWSLVLQHHLPRRCEVCGRWLRRGERICKRCDMEVDNG